MVADSQRIEARVGVGAAGVLGVISIVFGAIALLGAWVPLLGLLAIPGAAIGAGLAVIGALLSLMRRFRGIGTCIVGLALCVGAIALAGTSTVAFGDALAKAGTRSEATDAEKAEYIKDHLTLYDATVSRQETVLNGLQVAPNFKLRNNGQRALSRVKVTFYFLDEAGDPVAEESYYPVRASRLLGNRNVLKPGYVWQQEEGKVYTAKHVPTEWVEGRFRAEIADIEFGDT